jgi:flavin-dependent dehydrogenase
LLAQRGLSPVLFADEKAPDLLVGESLIPAIIPILQRLGVEERVGEMATLKPGVSFVHPKAVKDLDFTFDPVSGVLPTYAYNVPRPAFDELLSNRAAELGVMKVRHRAKVVNVGDGRLELSEESLAAAPVLQGRQPDWLIDASGRNRFFARTLNLPSQEGPRRDVAYFAHFEGCYHPKAEGQVIITRLEQGWSWRIPLPDGRMSIGVVLNKFEAEAMGATAEERLLAAIQRDPYLEEAAACAQRVSPVKTYANYQLVSEQAFGPGWVQLGDAYGFVDPMLSPGLFMAMKSADILADVFIRHPDGPPVRALRGYQRKFDDWLAAWTELIELFYDGRIFSLQAAGDKIMEMHSNPVALFLQKHMNAHIACMAAGAWTTRAYSRRLLRFSSKHLIWGVAPPEEMAIA